MAATVSRFNLYYQPQATSAADSGGGRATKRSHGAGTGEVDVEAEARKGNVSLLL